MIIDTSQKRYTILVYLPRNTYICILILCIIKLYDDTHLI